jgi:hypothetical protein
MRARVEPVTCWRRLRHWNEAGVRQRLYELPLSELRAADLLDFSRAAVDSGRNRHDVTQLIPLIQAVPPIRGKRGRPWRRPR